MPKLVILITGQPGTGKTTLIMRIIDLLKVRGIRIGGMTTKEKCEGGVRVGFEILDMSTGKRGWLAHVAQPNGPRVGKYTVNLDDLKDIGVGAIRGAVQNADVIVIDEIGPMELHSQQFRQAVLQAIRSAKPVMATIHYRDTDTLARSIKTRPNTELIEVTVENRDALHNLIIEKITKTLQGA